MNLTENYYKTLELAKTLMRRPLKRHIINFHFSLHPDKNPDVDPTIFHSVVNAYNIL
jgi:DnaJ-class molecular chaperone